MPYASQAKREVREIELCWIPLSDGRRLAARLFVPEDAEQNPVPAILEYLPYRRRDLTRARDQLAHPYLAAHGYACIRLDIRGTGDSDGLILDEYLKQEQDDAVEAIAWIASQPWCTGNVGMMGLSWGGFNSLQIAACRPPALKAIITACSTDDRYADDMHYMGGCLLTDMMVWGTSFFGRMALPPDPLMVGEERWQKMWLQRLEASTPIFMTWMEHQRRDEFWKHGSICEDYSSIEAAVLAVGGWADGYSNAVCRLLEGLRGPRLGIIGPWGHKFPDQGVPGPAIGFLQESLRWWDHWLKGADTGIMNEPMLRAYVQDSVPPQSHYDLRPGRWVGVRDWPSDRIAPKTLWFSGRELSVSPGPDRVVEVNSPQTAGIHAGEWCPYGLGGLTPELPLDQREDDARSLVFDSPPLEEDLEILGAAVVTLAVAADQPSALVVARLNDVAPDGASTRVTYGVLNLTHRDGHEEPRPLEPGQRYQVRIQLNDIGHRFRRGHVVRLAISNAYWPIVWPSPKPTRLSIATQASSLSLPVYQPVGAEAEVGFPGPETALPARASVIQTGGFKRSIDLDVSTGEIVHTVTRNDGRVLLEDPGIEIGFEKAIHYRIRPGDPLSARIDLWEVFVLRHEGWDTRVEVKSVLSSTLEDFVLGGDLVAFDSGYRFFSRSWTRRIPRDLV
jgi:putative CocE/NonD family hydrolase